MNFPYSPLWWQTCISLPDEQDKVLAGREGSLLFDYERGGQGHREFRVVLEPALPEGLIFREQRLADPKVPILINQWEGASLRLSTEVLAVAPPDEQYELEPPAYREGGEDATAGWDGPREMRVYRKFYQRADRFLPEFCDAAWSTDEIVYCFRVEKGAGCNLVLGFAEGQHLTEGQRILQILADGAEPAVLDPVAAYGAKEAGLFRVAAKDADEDGLIKVRIRATPASPDQAAFVNAIWLFYGASPSDDAIFSGEAEAEAFADCGRPVLPRRRFLMSLEARNESEEAMDFSPSLRIRSLERVKSQRAQWQVGYHTRILADALFIAKTEDTLALPAVTIPPGQSSKWIWAIDRNGYEGEAVDAGLYARLRAAAQTYWHGMDFPYAKIEVPDARIQALIDSSIRNIFQARDIERGLPAFHVGPTCYRQLWIVDGAFLLELATILGLKEEARAGIAYMLQFQDADGGFQLKARYWKETGIVVWALVRHAVLTNDKDWLRCHWEHIQRAVDFIRKLRNREGAGEPGAREYQLAPYGDIDGGISNMEEHERFPEYSNAYWLLAGLKASCDASKWLGTDDAEAWEAEYEDFLSAFRKAAARDLKQDALGNSYLPIRMGARDQPQKAQWAFCHAVAPGGIFPMGDPMVKSSLAMLQATKVEGLVFDTGWMNQGLWTYFASFYGHAQLWDGNFAEAASSLEAFADHASPTLVWREEQKPAGCGNEEVGDMPHNWASAEFIRLAIHLIALERDDALHLFHGIPSSWIFQGSRLALRGVATAFGSLDLSLSVSDTEISVEIAPLSRPCRALFIHCEAWSPGSPPLQLSADHQQKLILKRN